MRRSRRNRKTNSSFDNDNGRRRRSRSRRSRVTKSERRSERSKELLRYRCSTLTIESDKSSYMEEEDDGTKTYQYTKSADEIADSLLRTLQVSVGTLSPMNSRQSYEIIQALPV